MTTLSLLHQLPTATLLFSIYGMILERHLTSPSSENNMTRTMSSACSCRPLPRCQPRVILLGARTADSKCFRSCISELKFASSGSTYICVYVITSLCTYQSLSTRLLRPILLYCHYASIPTTESWRMRGFADTAHRGLASKIAP